MPAARRALWPVAGSVVLVVFLSIAVFPTRTWIDQRDQIATERQRVALLSKENQRLAARVNDLHNDSEVERIAREQYNLVKPGEEAYAILPGPADPQPKPTPTEPPRPRHRSLWEHLEFWR